MKTPLTYNVTCVVQNQTYSQEFEIGTTRVVVKTRNGADLKTNFYQTDLESGTYWTVWGTAADAHIGQGEEFTSNLTLYFQSSIPGTVVEIIAYGR